MRLLGKYWNRFSTLRSGVQDVKISSFGLLFGARFFFLLLNTRTPRDVTEGFFVIVAAKHAQFRCGFFFFFFWRRKLLESVKSQSHKVVLRALSVMFVGK